IPLPNGSGILFAKARGRRCSMQAFVVLLTVALVLVAHVVAVAGPGDPRLVNGVLEWPRTVTNEPFLVVRGDDGVLYYVGIAAAPAAAPVATSPAGTVPASPPAPPPTTVTPPAPKGTPAPAVAPPAPPLTAPGMTVTPGAAAPSTAALAPAPPATAARSAAVAAPMAARRPIVEAIAAPATLPVSAGDERRWTEISGVGESLVRRTLILRSDEGRVAVDVSSLSPSLERMATPGTMVRVYGVPVEMRFKAMGFFDPGGR